MGRGVELIPSPPVKIKVLKSTHPRLDPFYVRVLRALYKGGKTLLRDAQVMEYVFPKTAIEGQKSYDERKNRAFYDPDFALVINTVMAGLAQDPLSFDPGGTMNKDGTVTPEPDPYWHGLQEDAGPPGAPIKKSWDSLIREVVCEGTVCELGWVLCEMPQSDPTIETLADQEAAGKLRGYIVPYRMDSVTNWAYRGSELLWVRTYSTDQPADNFWEDRSFTRHTWRVWTADSITTYELELNKDGKRRDGGNVQDDDFLMPVSQIPHGFGVVPWVCYDTNAEGEPSMHIGGLIESRCRALFNESCGESFLRTRAMFQQLYEFLGPEMPGPDSPISEAQQNENRASRSMGARAPDVVQIRGREDDARYISPDMAVASINRQALADGREAIPRVTGQLALASDTSGAMLRRSGDSKAQDKIAQEVLLGATGKKARGFARSVAEMLARGRGQAIESVPKLSGYEHFESDDTAVRVEQHVALAGAGIPSATFQREENFATALAVLGDVTPEIKATIKKELEEAITHESVLQSNMPPVPPGHQLDKDGKPIPLPPRSEPDAPAGKFPPKKK